MSARTRAQAPVDQLARLDSVARQVVSIGATAGTSIWPGFRPDTIPVAFVFADRGTLLVGWAGTLPKGFAAAPSLAAAGWRDARDLGAASTGTMIEGRRVAQVAMNTDDPAALVATAVHEAFHVIEAATRGAKTRFGTGENSMFVSQYPVFDVDNETGMALEGAALAAALDATSPARKRTLARQFAGLRRVRHRAAAPELATFDQQSEMNEGLAQYAFIRAARWLEQNGPGPWRASAAKLLASERDHLANLTANTKQSFRFRYYATGPAIALLLDDIAGARWKEQLLSQNTSLQDLLAQAVGLESAADSAKAQAERTLDVRGQRASAASGIDRLKTLRGAQVDSVLGAPGVKLIVRADSLPGRDFNSCGFDPQNHLQVSPTVQLQTRWWRPCTGGPTYLEFNVPSVHDAVSGTVSAVIGDASSLKLTIDGQTATLGDGDVLRNVRKVRLEAPRASVDAVRADIARVGMTITVYPKTP